MKINKLLCLFIAISLGASAQIITIRNNSTQEPLHEVIIQDKNNVQVKTDTKGRADVSELSHSDSVLIYQFGYNTKKTVFRKDSADETFELTAKGLMLDEIILSANRKEERKIDVPYTMEIIKQKDVEFQNPANTGVMLENTGQVFVQRSQAGGGSPSMRGFEANKVLIVVDGIRMNNAIYRGGHLQDVMTLDANMLDRTELLFGPSSTMYGSDALGGVMHFYTKNAQFTDNETMLVKTNAMVRYATATNEKTAHLDFNLGWKKIASLTNITASDFGDVMSGSNKLVGYTNTWDRNYYVKRFDNRDSMVKNSNTNLQVQSGYKQLDLMQRFNIKTGAHLNHNLNLQYSTTSFLPRYDRLNGDYSGTNLKFAENGYGPQKRFLGSYTLNYDAVTKLSDNIKLILAYQKIDQDRITRRFQNNNRITQQEDVNVLSANLDVYKVIKLKHELRYGAEFTSNDVKSTATSSNITTGVEKASVTRYADGANKMSTIALYASHSWEVSNNFIVTDGLRFTATNLLCEFKDTTFYKSPFNTAKQNNQALTGSIGLTWKDDNNYKVSLLANTGFRSPNVDDMSKLFESGGGIVIVANPTLKPEYTYNIEMNISKIMQKNYKIDVGAFYTQLTNALITADYQINGQDSIVYNGSKSKIQAMQNADYAYLYGAFAGIQIDFNEHLSFKSNLNYTYARYVDVKNDTIVPLDHIAPLFGITSLSYKLKRFDSEFFVRYNGKKTLANYSPSGEDNPQYATANGMPAWFTLNVRMGVNITKSLRLNVACENITDNRYRAFASGINAPGRNFIMSLRLKI